MCERVWRIAQVCAKKQGLATGSRGWLVAASSQIVAHVPCMPEAEALHQLFTIGQKFQASQAVCSRLELATQPSREIKPPEHPIWQNMTFHIPSHPTIYILLYPRFRQSFQREFCERNPRENKIDSSTIFTYETLQIPLLSSFPLSNPWEVHYQTFSHHIYSCERAVWCFGKQLGRNQFHIGWCYGQVAESEKVEKK